MKPLFTLITFSLTYFSSFAQKDPCEPQCNIYFNDIFRMRCPTEEDVVKLNNLTIAELSFSPDKVKLGGSKCGDQAAALLKKYRNEDEKNEKALRAEYCNAQIGWSIKKDRICYHGGPPPCCTANDLPWEQIDPKVALQRFIERQEKIYQQRLKELANVVKPCKIQSTNNDKAAFNRSYEVAIDLLTKFKEDYPSQYAKIKNDYERKIASIKLKYDDESAKEENADFQKLKNLSRQMQEEENAISELIKNQEKSNPIKKEVAKKKDPSDKTRSENQPEKEKPSSKYENKDELTQIKKSRKLTYDRDEEWEKEIKDLRVEKNQLDNILDSLITIASKHKNPHTPQEVGKAVNKQDSLERVSLHTNWDVLSDEEYLEQYKSLVSGTQYVIWDLEFALGMADFYDDEELKKTKEGRIIVNERNQDKQIKETQDFILSLENDLNPDEEPTRSRTTSSSNTQRTTNSSGTTNSNRRIKDKYSRRKGLGLDAAVSIPYTSMPIYSNTDAYTTILIPYTHTINYKYSHKSTSIGYAGITIDLDAHLIRTSFVCIDLNGKTTVSNTGFFRNLLGEKEQTNNYADYVGGGTLYFGNRFQIFGQYQWGGRTIKYMDNSTNDYGIAGSDILNSSYEGAYSFSNWAGGIKVNFGPGGGRVDKYLKLKYINDEIKDQPSDKKIWGMGLEYRNWLNISISYYPEYPIYGSPLYDEAHPEDKSKLVYVTIGKHVRLH